MAEPPIRVRKKTNRQSLGWLLLKVQDDFSGDPGGHSANLGASFPAVSALLVKGFSFVGADEMIDLAVANLMDLFADRVADFFLKEGTNPVGFFHRLSILHPIFKPLPSNY